MEKGVLVREEIRARFQGTKVQWLRVEHASGHFTTGLIAIQLRPQKDSGLPVIAMILLYPGMMDPTSGVILCGFGVVFTAAVERPIHELTRN